MKVSILTHYDLIPRLMFSLETCPKIKYHRQNRISHSWAESIIAGQ